MSVFFVYLFMAPLGLCCCTWTFSGCSQQGATLYLQCAGFSLQWLLLFWSVGYQDMWAQ